MAAVLMVGTGFLAGCGASSNSELEGGLTNGVAAGRTAGTGVVSATVDAGQDADVRNVEVNQCKFVTCVLSPTLSWG